MPGEQGLERLEVAHDVDHRLRSPGIGRHRRRRPEDPQQRIETTLRIGPRQQRRRRIRTVQLRASSDVGTELVFDEPLEDAQHLRRVQRPPSARPQVDATVDLVQPGGAVGVIRLGVIEGAVLIGEVLPPSHDGAEVLEREMLGVFEQEVEHLDQPRPQRGLLRALASSTTCARPIWPASNASATAGQASNKATTRRMVDTSNPDQLAFARIHPLIERWPSSPYTPRASATATTAAISASMRRRSSSSSRNRSVIESLSSPISSSTSSVYIPPS